MFLLEPPQLTASGRALDPDACAARSTVTLFSLYKTNRCVVRRLALCRLVVIHPCTIEEINGCDGEAPCAWPHCMTGEKDGHLWCVDTVLSFFYQSL